MSATRQKKKGMFIKVIIAVVMIIAIALAITLFRYYKTYFAPNISGQRQYLYIHTGATFRDVQQMMTDSGIVKDMQSFVKAAEGMDYSERIRPGRYRVSAGMNNRRLINMLKSGSQEAVKFRFQNIRLKRDFTRFAASRLELDSTALLSLLNSAAFAEKHGFTTDNVYAMFIPNSYEMYWNTTAGQFAERMAQEYEKFWNETRRGKAGKIGLSPVQVSIMASIVDAEALYNDEMPVIAGLYMNRLQKGMKLESDPTVIFAANDFTIHRVLNRHLRIESPYNTYRYTGLPPGPINMPSISAIDAVLNYQKNSYLYMCAKEDFSGRHNFAATLAEHEVNARKFREALDARNIKR
ncbi:endolytic transglycosylase MltG [Hufsiella ginkgonis]|uniref:Endolytic murein transglycosylase n=1 Tax=Hufsiella ginkgonis TaxID=2695274 RepID=A0A7K1Y0M3_9SPHI|nr:endolytic transglycosylase MltG [Hufsiella ginkgonis]MXV16569.1 endolytic transglycosylase MltG [Hufsiella ginkgonis]